MGGKLSFSRQTADAPATSDNDSADDPCSPLPLTDQERQVIMAAWKTLRDSEDPDFAEEELGVRIFLRIFELTPEVKQAFPQFAALPDRQAMMRNVMFRCHGRRFVRAVRSVVDNLDSLGVSAVPNLDLLGRKHRDFHGFKPEYLSTFETAMEDVWRESLGRKFDKRPWRKVFRLITATVLQGYEEPSRTCTPTCPASSTSAAAAAVSAATPEMPNDANGSLPCRDNNSQSAGTVSS